MLPQLLDRVAAMPAGGFLSVLFAVLCLIWLGTTIRASSVSISDPHSTAALRAAVVFIVIGTLLLASAGIYAASLVIAAVIGLAA